MNSTSNVDCVEKLFIVIYTSLVYVFQKVVLVLNAWKNMDTFREHLMWLSNSLKVDIETKWKFFKSILWVFRFLSIGITALVIMHSSNLWNVVMYWCDQLSSQPSIWSNKQIHNPRCNLITLNLSMYCKQQWNIS